MKIGVIGGGKWGQALHFAFSRNHESMLWSRTPKKIEGFASLEEVLACEYLVFALPAQIVSAWLDEHFVDKGQKILVAAKGIEVTTGRFLNEIFTLHVSADRLAYLSGPSFASEVIQSLPTAVVISSCNQSLAETFSRYFPVFMKTYIADDIIGAEVCGAYKNVIAIASGICDGLALGNNARASLIARGLVEMQRFAKAFGANDETFLGLSGAGDLFLTATSTLSRNYRVGVGLAQGKTLETILDELGEVAEGVYTSQAIARIVREKGIYAPIATEVEAALNGKSPLKSVQDLLGTAG